MQGRKTDNSPKLNIGAPSIILLLTVLGLSVFAILSVRAAYNGLKLAEKSQEAVAAYYAADKEAERILFDIMEAVEKNRLRTDESVDFLSEVAAKADNIQIVRSGRDAIVNKIVYRVAVDDESDIRVVLEAQSGNFEYLRVVEHRLVTTAMDGYNASAFDLGESPVFY